MDQGNIEDQRRRLIEADRHWMAAVQSGEVEKALAVFSDDATVMAPGVPTISGRDAVGRMLAEFFGQPGFHIEWRWDQITMSEDAAMAYCIGANRVTVADPNQGTSTTENRLIVVWRREQDDEWRCVLDFWAPQT